MLKNLNRLIKKTWHKNTIWFSPWLVIGMAGILVLAIGVLAASNAKLQKEQMVWHLKDKADALIWALEGSARFMTEGGTPQSFPSLFSEVARQPGVVFLALTDTSGKIIAHSDSSLIGTTLHTKNELAALHTTNSSQWRIASVEGEKVFEVYKEFTPALIHEGRTFSPRHSGMQGTSGMKGTRHGGHGDRSRWKKERSTMLSSGNYTVFVGLDYMSFEEFLSLDLKNTLMTALAVALAGFAGVVSLFWAQNVRQSRKKLQDARAVASNVISHLPIGLITINAKGEILLLNALIPPLFGVSAEQIVGKNIFSYQGLHWETFVQRVKAKESIIEEDAFFHLPDKSLLPVKLSVALMNNKDGELLGFLFIIRDVKEVKALEEEVKRSERLSALGSLAAGVAHEIRNPLSSIKGVATYLAGKFSTADPAYEMSQMMVQEVERLNLVVSELLEFSRPKEVVPTPVLIADLLANVLRLAGSDAKNADVALKSIVASNLPEVSHDKGSVTQAVLNLVLNAIQASSPKSEVVVSAKLLASQEKDGIKLCIQVEDTGCGIAKDALSRIFTPYYTTKASGTGLGLSVTSQIVEKHGGTIQAESGKDTGTIFTMLIPVAAGNKE